MKGKEKGIIEKCFHRHPLFGKILFNIYDAHLDLILSCYLFRQYQIIRIIRSLGNKKGRSESKVRRDS